MKKVVNRILAFTIGILTFMFFSTLFVLIKSNGVKSEIAQNLPPNHLPYYLGFILISIAVVYAAINFISYFEKNFGDMDDIPNSRNVFANNYKSPFLKYYTRVAGALYAIFLIANFFQLANSNFGENILIGAAIAGIFGSIPIAYFLSKKSVK